MTLPLYCLVGYAAWALLLVGILGLYRARLIATGTRPLVDYARALPRAGSTEWRLCRAHSNACENLPVFGAAVLAGAVAQATSPAIGVLAAAVLVLRAVQSIVHVAFDSTGWSAVRATAFFSQQFLTLAILIEVVLTAR